MQKLIYYLFAVLIMLTMNVSIMAQGVDPGTANLAHSWTFNDGTANDYVGGLNGTLMGGAQVIDGSLFLNALNQWMEVSGDTLSLSTYDEITLETWFIPFAEANTGYHMLACFGNTVGTLGADYFFITPARGDDKSRGAISCGNTSTPWSAESGADGPEYDDGELHHMVCTLSGVEIALYIDGVQTGATALAANNSISLINPAFAYIGKSDYTGDPTWQGEILEFNIFNRVLTADEVLFLYNKGASSGIEHMTARPKEYSLSQNYPNPFNPTTTIQFSLSARSEIRLVLVNTLGVFVKEIASGTFDAGQHQIRLDASDLPSGVYFYKLEAAGSVEVRKLVLMK